MRNNEVSILVFGSISKELIGQISSKVLSERFVLNHKAKANAFIRRRKMPFESLVFFMLNCVKKSVQLELTEFMNSFSTHSNISKSAFCQQRMNLNYTAFIELNDDIIKGYYEKADYIKWKQFRVLCMDGSTLMLPPSKSIRQEFGVNSNGNNVPMARFLTLFDPLNEMMLSASIQSNISSELDMAVEQFLKFQEDDLVILDRGFGARWLFYLFIQKNVDFVIRIQHSFGREADEFWESNETSKILEVSEFTKKSKKRIGHAINPFNFRLVKVVLDNGEIEVLATSLLDEKKYPTEIFKELYFLRWGIETNYHHLKNHIEVGNFTGFSPLAIKQDFYANLMIGNIQALIIHDANERLQDNKKNNRRKYKINRNLSLGYLKNRVLNILMKKDEHQYENLVELFITEPVPIRLNRQFPRNPKRHKRRFYMNQKRCL